MFLEIFLYTNDSFILWEYSSDDGHRKYAYQNHTDPYAYQNHTDPYAYQNHTDPDSNNLKKNTSYGCNNSCDLMSLRERPFILETLPNEDERKQNLDSLPHVKQLQKSTKKSGIIRKGVGTNKKASTRKIVIKGKSSRGPKREKEQQKQKRENLEKQLAKVTLVKPDHVVDEQKWNKMVKYYPFVSKHSDIMGFVNILRFAKHGGGTQTLL